jgi:hypothetical protein
MMSESSMLDEIDCTRISDDINDIVRLIKYYHRNGWNARAITYMDSIMTLHDVHIDLLKYVIKHDIPNYEYMTGYIAWLEPIYIKCIHRNGTNINSMIWQTARDTYGDFETMDYPDADIPMIYGNQISLRYVINNEGANYEQNIYKID